MKKVLFLLLIISVIIGGFIYLSNNMERELEEESNVETICYSLRDKNRNDERTKKLLKNFTNINEQNDFGETALHCAADMSNGEIAQLLISKGANVNIKDNEGRTPLFYIYSFGFDAENLEEILINAGADVSIKDNEGKTYIEYIDE